MTVEPDFDAGGVSMVVRAYDLSHRMMRARRQRSFTKMTSSDIVRQICGEHGLRADVTASRPKHEFVLQNNETDWDFVAAWRRRIGYEFIVATRPPASSRRRRARDCARFAIRTTCTPSARASPRSSR